MKVVILAGGFGTRFSEETALKPKPMIEIGDKPILWHIMKVYSHYGFNDFVICLGYKGYMIKEWFTNYSLHNSDVTFDLKKNSIKAHNNGSEPWTVTLVDTGANSMTGGRIRRIKEYVDNERFMLTYGDGLGDVDIPALIKFHKKQGKIATLTSVVPEGRFGVLSINKKNMVTKFSEKTDNQSRINGGFFVLEPEVFDYIEGDETIFEKGPLEKLASEGELSAYPHNGFWKPMDKLYDKKELEKLWESGSAPWKIWE